MTTSRTPQATRSRIRSRRDQPSPADEPAPRLVAVEALERTLPNWEPLLELVGEELASWFAWLGAVRLEDGAELLAYRHTVTRTELRVAADGRAFAVDSRATLPGEVLVHTQIPRARAITQAVAGWGRTRAYEPGKHSPLIDAAVSRAVLGARFWVDPNYLRELQRRDERRPNLYNKEGAGCTIQPWKSPSASYAPSSQAGSSVPATARRS